MSEARINVVKKMSPKLIVGHAISKSMIPEGDKQIDLYTVFGVVRGVKKGEGNFGPWTQFNGDFQAVNLETGEETRSNKIFLPEVLQLPLENALAESEKGVEFASVVGIRRHDSPIGYEYYVTPIVKMKESDALATIRKTITDSIPKIRKALPAPATAATGKGKGGK